MTAREWSQASATELVPLAERIRYLQVFRVAGAALALAFGIHAHEVPLLDLAMVTTGWLALSFAAGLCWRLAKRRGLPLFGAMLLLDGLWLAIVTTSTGATRSPLQSLVLLHLIAVALLASYRTGAKLALWHSLLLLVAVRTQPLLPGWLHDPQPADVRRTGTFVVVFWLVALSTAAFSAVNERELRRRRYDLEALTVMATRLEEVSDPSEVAVTLVDALTDAFGFARAAVLSVGDTGARVLAHHGEVRRAAAARPAQLSGSTLERVCAGRGTLLVTELDPRYDGWLRSVLPSARNLLLVPLIADGVHGVVVIEHALRGGSRIERRVVTMVERFASHASLALVNARLLERMATMAATDGLTGLANRRTFDEILSREIARSQRTAEPSALLLLDIDHFKDLNDAHGHDTGDQVLRAVAEVLGGTCRELDIACRYGGEEFAIVLPATDQLAAREVAERLRLAVRETPMPVAVTISAGVAVCPLHATDPQQLVQAADQALYRAKRAGRDRVAVFTPEVPPTVPAARGPLAAPALEPA